MASRARLRWKCLNPFTPTRNFSSTSPRLSYVGSNPIVLPPDVYLTRSTQSINIKGPLGSTSLDIPPYIHFTLPGSEVALKKRRNAPCPKDATAEPFELSSPPVISPETPKPELTMWVADPTRKEQRMMWGLLRTLLHNAIVGHTEGFRLPVYLIGVGYRAALEPDARRLPPDHKDVLIAGTGERQRLALKLGYSHTVYVPVPKGITVTLPSPTIIELFSTDKQQVGQFAANIRVWRKPEPYKGKGVFVGDERIKMKSGKKK